MFNQSLAVVLFSEVLIVIVVGSTPHLLEQQRATGFRNLTQTLITDLRKLDSDNDSETSEKLNDAVGSGNDLQEKLKVDNSVAVKHQ
jgi:hypothetical protein